ncbi:MAG: guanylate kinase [Dehalococcoidales bacterium]|nr:guanylate kinase [Dehalococcoidales bacterium]MDP7415796.1 guanylate kinase [Dehalococcoidales bacterium]
MSRKHQLSPIPTAGPLLLVLSGPSGVGKDAVLSRMRERDCSFVYVITVTTRPQRVGERDNIDYRFVSSEKFQEMIDHGEFLEWANVYGNHYGVPRKSVKQALDSGRDTVVKVDVQGAAAIKKILPQAVLIFLMSSSVEELMLRLKQRRTESSFDLALRSETARKEIEQLSSFDYAVYNWQDEVDRAVSEVAMIVAAEKCRVTSRETSLPD